jgi:hypothetical protein
VSQTPNLPNTAKAWRSSRRFSRHPIAAERGTGTQAAPDCFRRQVVIEPDNTNQLRDPSRLMVDKITTVPRSKLGERMGRLGDDDRVRLGRAALVFLGLAGS